MPRDFHVRPHQRLSLQYLALRLLGECCPSQLVNWLPGIAPGGVDQLQTKLQDFLLRQQRIVSFHLRRGSHQLQHGPCIHGTPTPWWVREKPLDSDRTLESTPLSTHNHTQLFSWFGLPGLEVWRLIQDVRCSPKPTKHNLLRGVSVCANHVALVARHHGRGPSNASVNETKAVPIGQVWNTTLIGDQIRT